MKESTFLQDAVPRSRYGSRKGFSIVEVAIAMGVVTLLLTTFIGVFGPAQKNITRALSSADANRMKDALAQEMSVLRTGVDKDASAFDKAITMISGSHAAASAVLVYQYKAIPTPGNLSGILPPYVAGGGIQGKNYIIQTAVRVIGQHNTEIAAELATGVVDGPVFAVRMTQLVSGGGGLVMHDAVGVFDPAKTATPIATSAAYPKAVIPFRADFFRLKSNAAGYVTGGGWTVGTFDALGELGTGTLGNAVAEVTMSVRR